MATWVSFGELRERVSIQDIFEHYGMLGKLKPQGDELVGPCPFHDDRRPWPAIGSLGLVIFREECGGTTPVLAELG